MDVVATVADLGEGGRLHAVLLPGSAGDGVEPDVRDLLAVVPPDVGSIVLLHDARRDVAPLGREMSIEHGGRLDDVVVHADQDEVFDLHDAPSLRCVS